MIRNVRLYLTAEFLKGMSFAYAIATLFYQEVGLNFTELSLLWLAMALAQLMCEVPCGLLSDRIGHRLTVMAGFLVFAATMFCIGIGDGFWMMFLGGALWGVSGALLSGANDAFIYESLKEAGRESEYMKVTGARSMLMSLGIIVGSIPGAYLYTINIRIPWFMHAGAICLGLLCMCFTKAPPKPESGEEHTSGWQHLRKSIKQLYQNARLLWLTMFMTLAVFPLYGFALIRQPYLIDRGLNVTHLGYIFAGIEVLSSVISWNAHHIDKKFGFSGVLFVIIATLIGCYVILSHVQDAWALAPLTVLYASFRLNAIVLNSYTNKHIPSEQRATMLSIQSMGSSILLIAFMLSSGMILDTFSMDPYLLVLAAYIAVLLLPLWCLRGKFGVTKEDM